MSGLGENWQGVNRHGRQSNINKKGKTMSDLRKLGNKKAIKELEQIRKKSGGKLMASSVVDFARNPTSALHEYFEWDNTRAAELYRLKQAHDLIRVVVEIHEETQEEVRAYVSLSTERGEGYRSITSVMSDDDLKAILLADAKRDLDVFRRRYSILKTISEMEPVFIAIERLKGRE